MICVESDVIIDVGGDTILEGHQVRMQESGCSGGGEREGEGYFATARVATEMTLTDSGKADWIRSGTGYKALEFLNEVDCSGVDRVGCTA